MTFSFNTALSGLNAQSKALNVVGNNIANANTVGFRSSSITFADIFASAQGVRLNGAGNALQIGNGVSVGSIHTNFEQGSLKESGSPLHAAIQGNGFFVVKNPDGTSGYTRAGDFTVDNKGYLVASNGGQVQGYPAQGGVVTEGAPPTAVQIPIGQMLAPKVTSQATLRMNLNSSAATDSVFHAPMQVYDSRGTARTLDLVFTKQADGSFQMKGTLDGKDVQVNGGATLGFTFDTDGNLTAPDSLTITPDQSELNGAALPSIDIKLQEKNADGSPGEFNIRSFAGPSTVSATTQDGYSSGELNGARIDQDGLIYGVFSNGQSRVIGQFAIATFNAAEGLERSGGNMFSETIGSGAATIGVPGAGGRGLIAGGYLEQSNVNITNEFVDLIEAQRGFQANSRVITTLNQTLQDLMQIV